MRELSLNILDIVTNSIEAESSRVVIHICENHKSDRLIITIRDNGRGMDAEMVAKVKDPFVTSRTTRSVGMGISMLHQTAVQSKGDLDIRSQQGKGTTITVSFKLNCFNRPPLGDIADTVVNLLIGALDVHFCYLHHVNNKRFVFDSYWVFARAAEQNKQVFHLVEPAKQHILQSLHKIGSKV